jgi:hypothetical protein
MDKLMSYFASVMELQARSRALLVNLNLLKVAITYVCH